MNYWIVSPNVSNDKSIEEDWKNAIADLNYAFMGYDDSHMLGSQFANDISLGDIILIAQGQNSNKRVYLCGEVDSKATWEHLDGTPRSAQNIRLVNTLSKEELERLNLNFTGSAYGESRQPSAIYRLKPSENKNDKRISDQLLSKIKEKKIKMELDNYIKLLKYKHQIILQGPPGTGKTRLAKIIGQELTKSDRKLSFLEYFEWYIQNYKRTIESIKLQKKRSDLLSEFEETFPRELFLSLNLERYCQGTGTKDTFCNMIERGLKDLGQFSPGPAGCTVYGVYWDKENKKYKNTLDEDISPEDAMKKISKILSDLINNEDWKEAIKHFRQSYILKILNSYRPEDYFPMFSQKHLKDLAGLLEISIEEKNDIELNTEINKRFQELKQKHGSEISNFELMGHLYKKFDFKDKGVNEQDISVIEKLGDFKIIQFHPSFTYEDFVRGISAKTTTTSQIYYTVEDRVLIEMVNEALITPSANYVLIIDEINRANLPAVLGELIYALEYRYFYDIDNKVEAFVESLYDKSIDSNNPDRKLKLPENLYIIGTMNTADRSVGHIDYAIRRRFSFVDVLPNKDVVHPLAANLFQKVSEFFVEEFDKINWNNPKPKKSKFLIGDFRPEDVWIGHSYFISAEEDDVEAKEKLKLKLKYEIKPLLKEYVKDGILTEDAKDEIEELDGYLN